MANTGNSLADNICPTYAAGTLSKISGGTTGDTLNDSAAPGQTNGYANSINDITVGSFNSAWTNGDLSQNFQPVYRNGLLSFGNTGLQS